ncbi:MAG: rhomboid family intramembrane serine protease [Bacteroidota bacterium]
MDTKTRLLIMYRGFKAPEKVIAINVAIFLVMIVFNAIYYLFNEYPSSIFRDIFALPADLGDFIVKPWTFITYGFVHGGFWHLLFNCIGLYFTGRIFMYYFTEKQFITVYAYGIFAGAAIFLTAYNVFPALANQPILYFLVGASGGVVAITIAGATYAPNLVVNLFGVLPVKYWIIGLLLTISYIASIQGGTNVGGNFAHLGGAFIGYFYIKRIQKGSDIGIGFERFLERLVSYFTPKKKSPLKTVYKNKEKKRSTTKRTATQTASEKQRKIDAILDKISKSGYESLTKAEKDFLFKAGKEN